MTRTRGRRPFPVVPSHLLPDSVTLEYSKLAAIVTSATSLAQTPRAGVDTLVLTHYMLFLIAIHPLLTRFFYPTNLWQCIWHQNLAYHGKYFNAQVWSAGCGEPSRDFQF